MNGPRTDLQRTYNGLTLEGVESSRKAQQAKTSSLSYQSFAKRKARLREYIIWKSQGASPVSFWSEIATGNK